MYTGAGCFQVWGKYQLQMRTDVMSLTCTSVCMGQAKETLEIMGEDWVREPQSDTQWDAGLGCRSGEQPWENDPLRVCQCLSHTYSPLNFVHSCLIHCHLPCNITVWMHLHIAPGKDWLHSANGNKTNCRKLNFSGKAPKWCQVLVGQIAIELPPEGRRIQTLTPLEETESYQSQV